MLSETLHRNLVDALCKLPGMGTHLGRDSLLMGIPATHGFDRKSDNIQQDFFLLVNQLQDKYSQDDEKNCLLILIENAMGRVSGVTFQDELKALHTQVSTIVERVQSRQKQRWGKKHEATLMNCDEEVAIYRQMVLQETHQRVLLVKGKSKMGKSHLMREFRQIAKTERQIECALVDVRARGQNYKEVLHLMVQEIGYTHFNRYAEKKQQPSSRSAGPVANPADIMMALLQQAVMQSQGGPSADDQRLALTQAFLEDLMDYKSQAVLILDAFEEANEETQHWIHRELLIGLYKLPHILIVIAGQELFEPELTWEEVSLTTELTAVTVEDYKTYCQQIGATTLENDHIGLLHQGFKGRPGDFAEFAENFRSKGGTS